MKKVRKLEELFIYFLLYSIIGWIYEVLLELFIYSKTFVNRGFLFGPYLPVYGFGAIIILVTISKLKEKEIKLFKINITPVLVFFSIMAITTVVELIASYFLDLIIGEFLWDYSHYPFLNFQNRIAFFPSLRFAIGGTIFMYLLQPVFEKIVNKFSHKKLNVIFIITLSTILIDLFVKIIALLK